MNKTRQLLIGILVIDMALIGAYGFLFYLIKTKSEETSALSRDLGAKQATEDQVSTLRHAVNETKDDRTKLESYFVRSGNIDAFIEFLKSLGKEAAVDITLSGLTETKGNSLTVDLRAQGTFDNLFYFTKLIEYVPYRIDLKRESLALSGPREQKNIETSVGKKGNTITKPQEIFWDASFTLELFGFIKE